jgi:hypothetical protein
MPCEVEYTDEFGAWWDSLTAGEQKSVAYSIRLLEDHGIDLRRPQADTIHGSVLPNLRELRCQHQGPPYRILYVFDPRRKAILLIGGEKTGNPRWYLEFVPKAEKIYRQYLRELELEDSG